MLHSVAPPSARTPQRRPRRNRARLRRTDRDRTHHAPPRWPVASAGTSQDSARPATSRLSSSANYATDKPIQGRDARQDARRGICKSWDPAQRASRSALLTTSNKRHSLSTRVGFRFYRHRSLGSGFWAGLSKSGVSVGKRGRGGSLSLGGRGHGGSVRLGKGLSYVFRRKR